MLQIVAETKIDILFLQKRPPKGPRCLWATPDSFNFFLLPDSRSNLSHSSLAAVTGILQQNHKYG
jgi:hypothetical protein